jgi:hypothetical protein
MLGEIACLFFQFSVACKLGGEKRKKFSYTYPEVPEFQTKWTLFMLAAPD